MIAFLKLVYQKRNLSLIRNNDIWRSSQNDIWVRVEFFSCFYHIQIQ